MMNQIAVVEDTYEISGKRLVIESKNGLDGQFEAAEIPVEIRRPDGSILETSLRIERVFFTPASSDSRLEMILQNLVKADVPVGSEVWG